jgi:outer membrane protein assembly factor BamB
MPLRQGAIALLLLALLGGCASGEKIYVAPLPEIDNQFKADKLWSARVGDGVDDFYTRLRPVVAYGKVFAASRFGDLKAFDAASGETLWQSDVSPREPGWLWDTRLDAQVSGGLSAQYNQIYLGTERGMVIALDAETGEEKWQVEIGAEVLAPPSVDDGAVVVTTGAGTVVALDAETGRQLWRQQLEVPQLTLRGTSSVAIVGGGVVVGKPTGKVAVLALANGNEIWQQDAAPARTGSELERLVDVDADPQLMADKLYVVAYNGFLQAMELRSGRVLWSREFSSYRGFTLTGSSIYLTDYRGFVHVLNRENGEERWRSGILENRGVTEAVALGRYLVVGDGEGYLYFFAADSGELASMLDIGNGGFYSAPIVDNGTLYIQARNGRVTAIRLPQAE